MLVFIGGPIATFEKIKESAKRGKNLNYKKQKEAA
jgi:hypothetical protein